MMGIVTWLVSHGWRQLLGAGVMLALFLAVLLWNVHERNIGDAGCEAKHAAASSSAQTIADASAKTASAKIDQDIARITAPLPGYLEIYGDRSHAPNAPNCAPVPYVRKLKVANP